MSEMPKLPQTPARVIRRRRSDLEIRRGYIGLLVRVELLVVGCLVLFTQVFMLAQAKGNEMFPAVKDGDLMFVFRLQRDYAKDDVIVYNYAGTRYVGRIVARENDIVTLDDSGTFSVNGTAQTGEIMYPTYAKEGITYPYTVPTGCVFVLADYRTEAEDSRDRGPIPMENVQGKVITILRRRGL